MVYFSVASDSLWIIEMVHSHAPMCVFIMCVCTVAPSFYLYIYFFTALCIMHPSILIMVSNHGSLSIDGLDACEYYWGMHLAS
jgi:hypothetical protein